MIGVAYVTFDIIRRVLEDYFGLRVFYVMNVTDVDDKIILRARRNYLFDKYEKTIANDLSRLRADVSTAYGLVKDKLNASIDKLESKLQQATQTRQKDELNEVIRNEKYKLENATKEMEIALAAVDVETMKKAAKSALAEWQDSLHGSNVTDQSIFRSHAAYYEKEFLEDIDRLGVKVFLFFFRSPFFSVILILIFLKFETGIATRCDDASD